MTPPNPIAPRSLLHTRHVTCKGYLRDDGLLDIEGQMQDIASNAAELLYRNLEAGGTIHNMRLHLIVDQVLTIQAARAFIDESPTPFCPQIETAYAALVGQTIGPGFTHKVKVLFGGTRGCTHLSELLGPMATTAFQTLYALQREKHGSASLLPDTPVVDRPATINTCHALHEDGQPAQRLWPLERRPSPLQSPSDADDA